MFDLNGMILSMLGFVAGFAAFFSIQIMSDETKSNAYFTAAPTEEICSNC